MNDSEENKYNIRKKKSSLSSNCLVGAFYIWKCVLLGIQEGEI